VPYVRSLVRTEGLKKAGDDRQIQIVVLSLLPVLSKRRRLVGLLKYI